MNNHKDIKIITEIYNHDFLSNIERIKYDDFINIEHFKFGINQILRLKLWENKQKGRVYQYLIGNNDATYFK